MSQVTILMLADISWTAFGRGLLALAAVWWAWVCYAWLTNTSDHARPGHRLLIFLAMAAMLVAAVADGASHSRRCPPWPWPVASRCSSWATSPTAGAITTSWPRIASLPGWALPR